MCRVGGLIQNAHLNFTENWQRSNVFIMTKVDHMPISWPLQFPLNAPSHKKDSLCFWKLATFDNDLLPFSKWGLILPAFFTLSTIDQIRDSQVSYSPSLTWLANNVEKSKEEEAKATEEFISCFRIKRPL